MTFGIIAAGEGSRLGHEGVAVAKPLVELGGEAMIDRLIRIFVQQGTERVVVIVNEQATQVRAHLEEAQRHTGVPHTLVVRTTPSSMHSFYELAQHIHDSRFCITTVDTIFCEDEFARFIDAFAHSDADGCMAVTRYVDDEKPLYVSTDAQLHITGFHDSPTPHSAFVSGGIYGLTRPALATLERCMERGVSRMRNFQRQLVADGLKLMAHPFEKIIDVDHASDIALAETFLSNGKPLLGIQRASCFSPNRATSDAYIYGSTISALECMGHRVERITEEEFLNKGYKCLQPAALFHSARSPLALQMIGQMEREGIPAVNTADSVAHCGRLAMTQTLQAAGVPFAWSKTISSTHQTKALPYPLWLKRAEGYTQERADVVYVGNPAEAEAALAAFAARGIVQVVANQHVTGDLVKFYGVRGTGFFHYFYPHPERDSKFGQEAINGPAQGIPFAPEALQAVAERAAQALGVEVYGGDAVVQTGGSIVVIDLNDWPSFAPCREEAAQAIAELIHKRAFSHPQHHS